MQQKMKNTFRMYLGCLVGVCSVFFVHAQFSECIKQPGAGVNGGFEILHNNLPVNWYLYTPATVKKGSFTITVDTRDVVEGKHSLVFNVKESSAEGGRFSPGLFQEFEVQPGSSYRIRLKVKNDQATVKFRVVPVSTKQQGNPTEQHIPSAGERWQEITLVCDTKPDFTRMRVELNILSAGLVKVDDFVLERISPNLVK